MTDWVTIKVPAEDRNDARDALDEVNKHRGVGNQLTYGDALVAGAEAIGDGTHAEMTATVRPSVDEDALDAVVAEVENALPDAGVADPEAIAEAVATRLDYAEVATRTADEVERRLTR